MGGDKPRPLSLIHIYAPAEPNAVPHGDGLGVLQLLVPKGVVQGVGGGVEAAVGGHHDVVAEGDGGAVQHHAAVSYTHLGTDNVPGTRIVGADAHIGPTFRCRQGNKNGRRKASAPTKEKIAGNSETPTRNLWGRPLRPPAVNHPITKNVRQIHE